MLHQDEANDTETGKHMNRQYNRKNQTTHTNLRKSNSGRSCRRTNRRKTVCHQGSAADQSTVNVRHGKKRRSIRCGNATTVKDAHTISRNARNPQAFTNACVHDFSLLRSGRPPRADRPDRLVRDNHLRHRNQAEHIHHRSNLGRHHRLRTTAISLVEGFPDTKDGRQAGIESRSDLLGDEPVVFAMQRPTLRVTDENPLTAHIEQHGSRDVPREGTALPRAEVLRAKPDPRPCDKCLDLRKIRVGRAHNDINPLRDTSPHPIDQGSILTLPTVHFPVADDQLFPHA